jgi:hypothetical protein
MTYELLMRSTLCFQKAGDVVEIKAKSKCQEDILLDTTTSTLLDLI